MSFSTLLRTGGIAALFIAGSCIVGCDSDAEDGLENAGDGVEEAAENVEDAAEDGADNVKDAFD